MVLALREDERRLDELNLWQERQRAIADLMHIGSALVLPHLERKDFAVMIPDEEFERIAMANQA